MKSNYRRLGDYIQQIDIRNEDLSVNKLLGVSIDKVFIESHANTVGVDFSNYKIIKRGQFAYGPVTSRNGDKVSIAKLEECDECIISSSYTSFEISKPSELNADYLMMLFKNPEFDRYARYNSWGSAREVFSWDELCRTEINIPSAEEQEKIVRQYKVVENRKTIIHNINNKLLEQADLIFKERFGFFKNDIRNLSKERFDTLKLPNNWNVCEIQDKFDISIGKTPPREISYYFSKDPNDLAWFSIADMKSDFPFISASLESLTYDAVNDYKIKPVPAGSVLLSFKMTIGRVSINDCESFTNEAIANFKVDDIFRYYLYLYLRNFEYEYLGSTSSISESINSKIVKALPFVYPDEETLEKFNCCVKPIFDYLYQLKKEYDLLSMFKIERIM